MARVVSVSTERSVALDSGWQLARADPDVARDPSAARQLSSWRPASVPGTVAAAVYAGDVALDSVFDGDDVDWWYRTRLPDKPAGNRTYLRCEGLATLCEVWLDDRQLFASDNMFVAHERLLDPGATSGELWIRFKSLTRELADRRGRARWRTRFVTHPELRRVRTALFGRMPGWTPLIPPIGPWRPIAWIGRDGLRIEGADVRSFVEGDDGRVEARIELESWAAPIERAELVVGETRAPLEVFGCTLAGSLRVKRPARWWPHTHGSPALYPVAVELRRGGETLRIDLGRTGFRELEIVRDGGDFRVVVNGVPVFCRGACWLPLDALALDAGAERTQAALGALVDAGMNFVRVSANGVYESDRFYEWCDELGILVWQDLAFCRLDYPSDEPFVASARSEARQLVDRLQLSPSLMVVCGNSEVEQQVAMLGLPLELARTELFERVLAGPVAELRPDVTYLPSSPSGGAQPFSVHSGITHYFGVGAYRRPLSDARLAEPRFASECLAFSHLPEHASLGRLDRWKAGIPQDAAASWDFEDVREHYLEEWFGVSARELRATDPERWLAFGRVVTGEIMARVLADWRRTSSPTRGAAIWHWADFCAGAGCGLLDASGAPKPAYWFVRRALAPLSVLLIDEGLNGVWVHAINETEVAFAGELRVALQRGGRASAGSGAAPVVLPPRAAIALSVESLIGSFVDAARAYRFGPAGHDSISATLVELPSGRAVSHAFHFPAGVPAAESDLGLRARLVPRAAGAELELESSAFAYAVHVEAEHAIPDDDWFHLAPGSARTLTLRNLTGAGPIEHVRISALNASGSTVVRAAAKHAR